MFHVWKLCANNAVIFCRKRHQCAWLNALLCSTYADMPLSTNLNKQTGAQAHAERHWNVSRFGERDVRAHLWQINVLFVRIKKTYYDIQEVLRVRACVSPSSSSSWWRRRGTDGRDQRIAAWVHVSGKEREREWDRKINCNQPLLVVCYFLHNDQIIYLPVLL